MNQEIGKNEDNLSMPINSRSGTGLEQPTTYYILQNQRGDMNKFGFKQAQTI